MQELALRGERADSMNVRLAVLLAVVGLFSLRPANGADPADVDALARDLRSTRSEVRARAAEALGKLGPQAAPAVRALVSALTDKSGSVQLEALIALANIGPAARA